MKYTFTNLRKRCSDKHVSIRTNGRWKGRRRLLYKVLQLKYTFLFMTLSQKKEMLDRHPPAPGRDSSDSGRRLELRPGGGGKPGDLRSPLATRKGGWEGETVPV